MTVKGYIILVEPIIKRVIVEIRYLPILGFSTIYPDVFQPLVGEFTALNEGKDSIVLRSDDRFSQISYESQKAGISLENLEDLSGFDTDITRLLNVLHQCNVGNLTRLGVRTWILYPFTSMDFDKSVADFRSHQFNEDHLVMPPEDLGDFAIVLEGKHPKGDMRIQYGIMSDKEIAAKVSQFQYEGDPEVALTFDIDNYTLDLSDPFPANLPRTMLDHNLRVVTEFVGANHDLFD